MGPTDPNAQAEGDRGLMGAIAGGTAGYYGGNKAGGHGFLGAIAGAFAGHKLEEKAKHSKHGHGKY
jgi:outer membrane lipoprotein SlyB